MAARKKNWKFVYKHFWIFSCMIWIVNIIFPQNKYNCYFHPDQNSNDMPLRKIFQKAIIMMMKIMMWRLLHTITMKNLHFKKCSQEMQKETCWIFIMRYPVVSHQIWEHMVPWHNYWGIQLLRKRNLCPSS